MSTCSAQTNEIAAKQAPTLAILPPFSVELGTITARAFLSTVQLRAAPWAALQAVRLERPRLHSNKDLAHWQRESQGASIRASATKLKSPPEVLVNRCLCSIRQPQHVFVAAGSSRRRAICHLRVYAKNYRRFSTACKAADHLCPDPHHISFMLFLMRCEHAKSCSQNRRDRHLEAQPG